MRKTVLDLDIRDCVLLHTRVLPTGTQMLTLPSRHPWFVTTIVIAGLAAWMDLGSLHDFQHADSLVAVLISTQRWTPFFWGQDRFGMLVPLLAMPIHHPLANLLVQGWMTTGAALLAPFVVARFLSGPGDGWVATGACANLLLLLLTPLVIQFDWFVTQPYGLSICLGFAALIVAGSADRLRDSAAGLFLMVLACWINIVIVAVLAIAAVARASRPVRLIALETAGAAIAWLIARYGATVHTITSLTPPRLWIDGWQQLIENSAAAMVSPAVVLGIAAAAGVTAVWLWKTGTRAPVRRAAVILVMAAGNWLVVGASLWVGMNRYSPRYMYPTLMLSGVGVATIFAALSAKQIKTLPVAAFAALAAVAMIRYGMPSLDHIGRRFDDRFGRQTAAVLESGATVIAGDYWRVWPAVFHANLALARAHSPARVFGLAYRSEETDPLWTSGGHQILIAASPDDGSAVAVAAEHGVAITLLTRLPEITLYARPGAP
jgi:hypothetical protein